MAPPPLNEHVSECLHESKANSSVAKSRVGGVSEVGDTLGTVMNASGSDVHD